MSLADTVRNIHRCGLSFPDLYLKHIYVPTKIPAKDTVRFSFLDLHRLRKKRRLSVQDRIRDLAAFCFFSIAGIE